MSTSTTSAASPRPAVARIVCGTDLSAESAHAAQQAAAIAHATGASLDLVTAVSVPLLDELLDWAAGHQAATDAALADARGRLDTLAADLARTHALPVQTHVREGHPVLTVSAVGDAVDADLLCVSTRGAGPFGAHFIGTTAEKIAQTARRPVLLVRDDDSGAYRRVLVAVDFSAWSAESVRLAHRLAPTATLHLVHALELWQEGKLHLAGVADLQVRRYREAARQHALERLRALRDAWLPADAAVECHVLDGADPWMLLVDQARAMNADLLVIGKQGRSALSETLLGSCTRMTLSESDADVLISVGT